MFNMEKYRYKNVEPVCILNFASEALKSSNSVGVDCKWLQLGPLRGSSHRATGPRWHFTVDLFDIRL